VLPNNKTIPLYTILYYGDLESMLRLCTTTNVFHIAETVSFLDHLNKVLFVDRLLSRMGTDTDRMTHIKKNCSSYILQFKSLQFELRLRIKRNNIKIQGNLIWWCGPKSHFLLGARVDMTILPYK